jgi:hypothetical protein
MNQKLFVNEIGGEKMKISKIAILAVITITEALVGSSCSLMGKGGSSNSSSANVLSQNNPTVSTQVPSSSAVVGRIMKGLPSVSPATGNFKTALAQVQTNLPSVTDPTKATGLDQIPLLVYAACADISGNTTTLKNSYSINSSGTVASNSASLVAAGTAMVNLHVGNLAAAGTALNSQVNTVFTTLVNSDISAGATTVQAFNTVCMAANSFGVGMTGF